MTGLFWIQFCQTRAKFIHHSFVSYLIMFKRLFKSIFNKACQQNIKIIAGYQVKKLADWKTYFPKYSLNIYLFRCSTKNSISVSISVYNLQVHLLQSNYYLILWYYVYGNVIISIIIILSRINICMSKCFHVLYVLIYQYLFIYQDLHLSLHVNDYSTKYQWVHRREKLEFLQEAFQHI